jgi:heme exporter protein A
MPPTTIYSAPPRSPLVPIPAVATREVARLFGRSAALAGVSLEVERGRMVALVGPNGAGKTTLLRILATSLRPTFGTAHVDGIDVAERPELVRPRVAYLSHATGLYDELTAVENLRFAATMLRRPNPARAAADALVEVGLAGDADRRVRGFSAGMRRRLALGRLLIAAPSLVLLDEPHAALDVEGMALVDRLLDGWRAAGATVLVASHQQDRVSAMADGWARLDGGLLLEVGGTGVSVPAASQAPAAKPATLLAADR